MLKRTALFSEHQQLNGKMVDFGGWELPVQYSGVIAEHHAVRQACGLFDVSHMGEIIIEGEGALAFLNSVTTNDASTLSVEQAQYSAFCNSKGGIVDDLVIYRLNQQKYLLVVNASNVDKDFTHLESHLERWPDQSKIALSNVSSTFSQIALQGPLSELTLSALTETPLTPIKTYWFKEGKVAGTEAIIARTGYTGEDGFEIYVPWEEAPKVWRALLEAGKTHGILPCGLGARDTLRLEMKYALYGHELNDDTNPLEVGLAWITKLNKAGNFVGKDAILKLKETGPKKALVGLRSAGRGIPRQGYEVYSPDKVKIGAITSGTQSPTLKQSIGVAFIDKNFEKIGTKVLVKVREDFHEFDVVKTPFIEKK